MLPNDLPNQLQDTLLKPVPRDFHKPIGYVCVLFGVALAAIGALLILTMFRGNGKPLGLAALLVCSAALGYFFAAVGRRLIHNRPNAFGSVASPTVWFTCFVIFGALTLLLVADALANQDVGLAQIATGSALLTLLAFGAASHFLRRKGRVR